MRPVGWPGRSRSGAGRRHFLRVLMLAVAGLGVGCAEDAAPPETVKVTGLVTYKNQPLSKGAVTFQPVDPGKAPLLRPAQGQIQSDGRYELSTFKDGDGALPGHYQIVVTSYENEPTAEEYDAGAKRISSIPERYSNALTSGLVAEVPQDPAGEKVEVNLVLED